MRSLIVCITLLDENNWKGETNKITNLNPQGIGDYKKWWSRFKKETNRKNINRNTKLNFKNSMDRFNRSQTEVKQELVNWEIINYPECSTEKHVGKYKREGKKYGGSSLRTYSQFTEHYWAEVTFEDIISRTFYTDKIR